MKKSNNLSPSASRRCYCGRKMSLAEEKAGYGVFSYTCPDCIHQQHIERFKHLVLPNKLV